MSLVILTKSPKTNLFSLEVYKTFIKKFIFRTRGPQAVTTSLLRGLNEIEYDYKFNPKIKDIKKNDIVWINESINALKFAINLKRNNEIYKLVVGPNIVITPDDENKIIQDENIDMCLVPSQWVKDFYDHFGTEIFRIKLRVWAAGIAFHKVKNENKGYCLVYKKDINEVFFRMIIGELKKRDIKYKVITYGKYKRRTYLNLLNRCSFMIYLQNVESQGIAMFEAWAQNVPTLVYCNDKYVNKDIVISGSISAPYLNDKVGLFFNRFDFNDKLNYFLEKKDSFEPQKFIEENFTDKICAEKFLDLIKYIKYEESN